MSWALPDYSASDMVVGNFTQVVYQIPYGPYRAVGANDALQNRLPSILNKVTDTALLLVPKLPLLMQVWLQCVVIAIIAKSDKQLKFACVCFQASWPRR